MTFTFATLDNLIANSGPLTAATLPDTPSNIFSRRFCLLLLTLSSSIDDENVSSFYINKLIKTVEI